ncbi:MAG: hypothetical protein HC935_02140 [Pseudanabaena sp. SU_2_4]|nr:hypothetical protein [Pseudanabaena sp. SU_2_4]NKB18063.1 hypothetical protein [Pseudanabaena sp. CRU_2_10]
MKVRTARKWLLIGMGEVILCLILLAIAPIFLNSNLPIIGFLIWLSIPLMLGGSLLYALRKVMDAQKSRNIFVREFPEYACLKFTDFLEIPSREMKRRLEIFAAIQDESDRDILNISPLDLLHRWR